MKKLAQLRTENTLTITFTAGELCLVLSKWMETEIRPRDLPYGWISDMSRYNDVSAQIKIVVDRENKTEELSE